MTHRLQLFIAMLLVAAATLTAADVTWSFRIVDDNTDHPSVELTAVIPAGYHLYSTDNPDGGGMPLSVTFDTEGCETSGLLKANKAYTKAYNDIFLVDEHYYEGTVKFTQKIKPGAEKWVAKAEIRGQICSDAECLQINEQHTFLGTAPLTRRVKEEAEVIERKEKDKSDSIAAVEALADTVASAEVPAVEINGGDSGADKWWHNVEGELKSFHGDQEQESRSLWYILIAGFLGGLLALLTPCVWPMIPMTVSFFLKSGKSRRKSIVTAAIYGLSIIVIYLALGLCVTAIFGASALNDLATNAIFNIIFFLLLLVFAFSFLGGFEITISPKFTNMIDSKVDSTTGYVSIFFMAFTLCLVSFSCTGPIIGTLLVEAATSDFLAPAIGMAGFAIALALPFSFFAMFPSMLKSMPKSGGWMNTVKVVLGFLELALAFKFLSVADLAYGWGILDREIFLSIWIVIFALLGVYLLGKIRLPHDDEVEKIGVTRFSLAMVSLAFAVYMVPGLWGAPLKGISAFAPPAYTQDFNLYTGDVHAQSDDYEDGMRIAAKLHKPVLIDFSGYGCVNCRKMEGAVLSNSDIKNMIDNDFVMITLMVDDKKALPEPIVVKEADGKERTLRTYGDKWSYLQRIKFGANAQPYYIILDNDGEPLNHPFAYEENVPKFMQFLTTGLENYLSGK